MQGVGPVVTEQAPQQQHQRQAQPQDDHPLVAVVLPPVTREQGQGGDAAQQGDEWEDRPDWQADSQRFHGTGDRPVGGPQRGGLPQQGQGTSQSQPNQVSHSTTKVHRVTPAHQNGTGRKNGTPGPAARENHDTLAPQPPGAGRVWSLPHPGYETVGVPTAGHCEPPAPQRVGGESRTCGRMPRQLRQFPMGMPLFAEIASRKTGGTTRTVRPHLDNARVCAGDNRRTVPCGCPLRRIRRPKLGEAHPQTATCRCWRCQHGVRRWSGRPCIPDQLRGPPVL